MTIKISRRLINLHTIKYLKSEINYCRIYFEDGTDLLSAFTLTKITRLAPDYFIDINRGLSVNPNFVKEYIVQDGVGVIILKEDWCHVTLFKVSRRKAAKVNLIFKQFKQQ
jgi:DNA-binding LytR/AlgR family response regulator